MTKIIICPTEEKMNILKQYENDNKLHQVKFFTKNEFIKNYYFDYNDKAIFYLIDKYNYNIDVARVYLKNLYYINPDKTYTNSKLQFLQNLKKELIDNDLLTFNPIFRKYLEGKEIEVINYYDLEKYIEDDLDYHFTTGIKTISNPIYKFKTMEDEINYICISIRKLLSKGIDINKIFLSNINEDYYYTLERLFKYYKIPINIPYHNSIYSTVVVQDFLKDKELDLDNPKKAQINKKITTILSDMTSFPKDKKSYKIMLEDKLKNTYLSNTIYDNAVNIKDLSSSTFQDDEYIFVLGFNLDSLPKTNKDIDFITDNEKDEVPLYKTAYLNTREKEKTIYLLSKIKNLTITFKTSSPFQSYYPSNLIDDLNLKVEEPDTSIYNYSDEYNKIKLGEMLDKYYVYGEKDKSLDLLNSNYEIPYKTYDNKFSGINIKDYKQALSNHLKVSYTSLNTYYECSFKYYIDRVLKVGEYEDLFQSFIGSAYHKILSIYKKDGFNFDEAWNDYLKTRDLSLSEKLMLVRIKKDLQELLETLKKQNLETGYNEELLEKEFKVELKKEVSVELVGFIDKIMFYKNNNQTYFSIVDYKSGYIDTHIEPLKYGLHLQLPTYLYLINKTNLLENPIFTGIYYQSILFDYPTWSTKLEKEIKDRYYLKGYSTDDAMTLERFDPSFRESNLIKSMKYTDEKGFSRYSKIISNNTLNELIDYTDGMLNSAVDSIIEAKFEINPKIYNSEEVACKFCPYKDICFYTQDDVIRYDKVEDLTFLGGDE